MLHAGYNLKADQGILQCATLRHLSFDDLHVVHWSGSGKPGTIKRARDAIEGGALALYLKHHQNSQLYQ